MNKRGRFLEACILSLLKEEETHGYNLLERLIHYEFVDKETNISIIYRALRAMEKDGLVISKWEESNQGPKKRLYEITSKGNRELTSLIEVLKHRRRSIDIIINSYKNLEK